MHAKILNSNKLLSGLFSQCIFNNIDRMQYYLILKIISAMYNLMNGNAEITEILIIYNTNGHYTFLNNWQDKYYFIGLFKI